MSTAIVAEPITAPTAPAVAQVVPIATHTSSTPCHCQPVRPTYAVACPARTCGLPVEIMDAFCRHCGADLEMPF